MLRVVIEQKLPLGICATRRKVLGEARPDIANTVASGEAIPAYPYLTVVPTNTVRIRVVAEELANGGGSIFVAVQNLFT